MDAERGYGNPGLPPSNAQLLFIFLYSLFWLCAYHKTPHCTSAINNAMIVHTEIPLPRRRWVDSRQLAYGRVIRNTFVLRHRYFVVPSFAQRRVTPLTPPLQSCILCTRTWPAAPGTTQKVWVIDRVRVIKPVLVEKTSAEE